MRKSPRFEGNPERVIAALNKAVRDGAEISVSGIARAARVDRAFFYRHRALLAHLHALEPTPPAAGDSNRPGAPRASLHTAPLPPPAPTPPLHTLVHPRQ